MIVDEETYLEHFGVKGMQWGVRKNKEARQRDRQAKREVKAKKFEAKAKMFQTKIKAIDVRLTDIDVKLSKTGKYSFKSRSLNEAKRSLNEAKKAYTEDKKNAIEDAEAKRQGKLSSGQKKVVKGAVVAGVILAAYGTYNTVQSGEFNRKVLQGKAFLQGQKAPIFNKKPILSTPDLTPEAIMAIVVKPINPNYGEHGTKMNCRRATFAYEMRRRGQDVMATRTRSGRGQTAIGLLDATSPGKKEGPVGLPGILGRMLKETIDEERGKSVSNPISTTLKEHAWGKVKIPKPKASQVEASQNIFSALATQPNGARGELGVGWLGGGGHSMAWEIVKGKPVIFDAQSGKLFRSAEIFHAEMGEAIKEAGFTRLDNVALNNNFLLKWVKDAA